MQVSGDVLRASWSTAEGEEGQTDLEAPRTGDLRAAVGNS